MEKLYTKEEYQIKSDEATQQGKMLYILLKDIIQPVKVLEWDTKKEIIPCLDEEGNETGETTTEIVTDYSSPILEPFEFINEITGETEIGTRQKSHTEYIPKTVGELVIADIGYYVCSQGNITTGEINTNYEQEQQARQRQRLDQLTLTPSDVERALYYSELNMDFDDLKVYIAEHAPQVDLKGLAIEFRANNFYRGAVDKNGNRIIDMVGAVLGYTPEDMDYLFEHKELPVKETAED